MAQSIWATESTDLVMEQFLVISITEEDGLTYRITGLTHRPDKFGAIDDGTRLEPPPVSVVPPSVQPSPANVRMSSHVVIDQGHGGIGFSWAVRYP